MTRLIKNPWTWILTVPIVLFSLLVLARVEPDNVLLTFGFLLFLTVSLAASKYALRAPALIYHGNISNEAVNIAGWAFVMLAVEATQIYRWVSIAILHRADWLTATYWNALIVYTMFVGFCMVAWSTRRAVPRPPSGRIGWGGFIVGFATAISLMLSGILPSIIKGAAMLFGSMTHAL